ncbi:MAG: 3-dehydroquinate synthase [Planctomycetota bacterium]
MPSTGPRQMYRMSFTVPFTHRVVFTRDVLGGDSDALLDVLEADEKARVMFVVDNGLIDDGGVLLGKVDALAERFGTRVEVVGETVRVTAGEDSKNDPAAVEQLLAAIHDRGLDRRSYIVVIGGGAVLDTVGFAAAIAHRGIRLVRLPSTTLGQADSGIGVKNAVNLHGKKNWQGTFAVPWAVINDEALLATLPDRDFRCGFSEAVKVALLKDADEFDRLCTDASAIAEREPAACYRAIERSAFLHLMHITRGGDPFEMREARPLDFGHWSAHRLEPMTGFALRHGEAVAIGVALDCFYSTLTQGFPEADTLRVVRCLEALRLPLTHPALARTDELLDGLEEFRQHLGGRLTITLLGGIGRPVDVHEIDPAAMAEAIAALREHADAKAAARVIGDAA